MRRSLLFIVLPFLLRAPAFAAAAREAELPAAMEYVSQQGILDVGEAGLQSEKRMTRMEFVSAIVGYIYPSDISARCFESLASRIPVSYTHLFRDVPKAAPASKTLCAGMKAGLLGGYRDGTFRPDAPITTAEAAVILTKAYGIYPYPTLYPNRSFPTPWYALALQVIRSRNILSSAAAEPHHLLTRGEASVLFYHLRDVIPRRVRPGETGERLRAMLRRRTLRTIRESFQGERRYRERRHLRR